MPFSGIFSDREALELHSFLEKYIPFNNIKRKKTEIEIEMTLNEYIIFLLVCHVLLRITSFWSDS